MRWAGGGGAEGQEDSLKPFCSKSGQCKPTPSGLLAHRLYWALSCGGPCELTSPASAGFLGVPAQETATLEKTGPPSFPVLVQPTPPWHRLLPSTLQNPPPTAPAEAPAPAGPRALLLPPSFSVLMANMEHVLVYWALNLVISEPPCGFSPNPIPQVNYLLSSFNVTILNFNIFILKEHFISLSAGENLVLIHFQNVS